MVVFSVLSATNGFVSGGKGVSLVGAVEVAAVFGAVEAATVFGAVEAATVFGPVEAASVFGPVEAATVFGGGLESDLKTTFLGLASLAKDECDSDEPEGRFRSFLLAAEDFASSFSSERKKDTDWDLLVVDVLVFGSELCCGSVFGVCRPDVVIVFVSEATVEI